MTTTRKLPIKPSQPITMAKSYFPKEDIQRFHQEADAILRGRLSMGAWVGRFEAEAARAHRARHAIATNSCTAALEIALLSCGIEPGDAVIVPVQTFIATAMAVHNIGARPLFADIREETLCLDPTELDRLQSQDPKAVIVVHFGGLIPPDVKSIQSICRERGWALIEDAAHAHAAEYCRKPAGSFGNAACFSYYPTKQITAGEAGMIVTNDSKLADVARSYQFRGQDKTLEGEQFSLPFGRNVRLPELSALLGVLQYGRLDSFTRQRRLVAKVYDDYLADESSLTVPAVPDDCFHNYWLYSVLLPPGVDRNAIKQQMKNRFEIDIAWSYFPPVHQMPVFKNTYGDGCRLPVAEDITRRNICLPIHPCISPFDAQRVAECFLHVYRELSDK